MYIYTPIIAALAITLGLVFNQANQASAPVEQAKDCCALKLACCKDQSACCAAPTKLGCCAKGLKCCDQKAACCTGPQECCKTGAACCDEVKACCGPTKTKQTKSCCDN